MTATDWPTYPHDGLGGPQHYPITIPALIDGQCVDEGECPTAEAVVCVRCQQGEPLIGDVSRAAEWPCAASLAEDGAA